MYLTQMPSQTLVFLLSQFHGSIGSLCPGPANNKAVHVFPVDTDTRRHRHMHIQKTSETSRDSTVPLSTPRRAWTWLMVMYHFSPPSDCNWSLLVVSTHTLTVCIYRHTHIHVLLDPRPLILSPAQTLGPYKGWSPPAVSSQLESLLADTTINAYTHMHTHRE